MHSTYPHLVMNFLDQFDVPLDDEPFVKIKSHAKLLLKLWHPLVLLKTLMVSGFTNVMTLNLF